MKKHFVQLVLVCALVLVGAGMGFAGNGKGPGDGSGPICDIVNGDKFSYEGIVVDCTQGNGLTLTVGDKNFLIYGIGPVAYWEKMGIEYPAASDELTAEGFTVDCSGTDRNIVMTITIGTDKIQLRDPVTGLPLWRGNNGRK
jgi:hypothetical protein